MPGAQITIPDQSITSRKVDLLWQESSVMTIWETTTSISFTDLATVGPSVTLSPGVTQDQQISLSGRGWNSSYWIMAPSFNEAAADDHDSLINIVNLDNRWSRTLLIASQPNGATHVMKYRVGGSTGTYTDRILGAVAI